MMVRVLERSKRRLLIGLTIAGSLLAPACLLFQPDMPNVKNYPTPETSASLTALGDLGCHEQYGRWICAPESQLGQLGCEQIRPAGEILSGLQPSYPMFVCLVQREAGKPLAESDYIYREGCLLAEYVRYVIQENGELRLLKSLADLQQVYAPVETEDEALSYALAASGLGVRYGITADPNLRYFVDEIEDTHVETVPEGFRVHLFDYKLCGCGPHPTYTVDVLVTKDGQVQELSREKVYEDPAEDKLCVD
jgi:hypothetical protein